MTTSTLRELTTTGMSPTSIRRAVTNGQLVRLRRGIYAEPCDEDARAHHQRRLEATARSLTPGDWWFSHASAAVLHGLPVAHADLAQVHVTRHRASGASSTAGLHRWAAPVPLSERTLVQGFPATALPRTLLDLARTSSDVWAVAAIDDALHRGLVHLDGLHAALADGGRRVGNPAARHRLELADGRSESVGESISRVNLVLAGLPAPELQHEFRLPSGHRARTDFHWPEWGLVGEFDGAVKYDAGRSVLLDEKAREDALRRLGLTVVRWGWDTALRRHALAALVRGAMVDATAIRLASRTA